MTQIKRPPKKPGRFSLTQDNILVGINWSGTQATGYDIEPIDCKKNIEAYLKINEI
jgi:hypothetical protein